VTYANNVNAGTASATANFAGDANHNAGTGNGSFVIEKATLTVTAQNASRAYGATNPAFSALLTGFVSGDTQSVVSGTPTLSTTATQTSTVGTSPITATAGTLSAANYTFSFVPGTLTVNTATLTVTAQNAARAYGATNPTFSVLITGFVNGDTQSVV